MREFEVVLQRHRAAIIATYGPFLKNLPRSRAEWVDANVERLVDVYIAIILTHITPEDPAYRSVMQTAASISLNVEDMMVRIQGFFTIIEEAFAADSAMTIDQKAHIGRMLEQSRRYLVSIAIPSLRSSALEKAD